MGHPCKFQRVSRLGSVTARHSSSECEPHFAALNRGRHLYSAGRSSPWALAHILVELFSLALTVEAVSLQCKTCQDWLLSGGGVGQFEPRFQRHGVVPGEYFLVSTKLDTFCYLTVQTAPCYVTDRRNCRSWYSACHASIAARCKSVTVDRGV